MKSKRTFRLPAFVLLLFISFFFINPRAVEAGTVSGASITYQHLAGNMYTLRLTFYRDCFGIAAPSTCTIDAQSVSCGVSVNYTLLPVPGTGMEINPPCTGIFSMCSGGAEPGFEKWEYELDAAIPAQCSDWIFSFTYPIRNHGTIILAGSALRVESRLNNAFSDNNSPQFLNDPLERIWRNQTYHFNHGILDPDGDSLVYQLVDAVGAVYIPPHTGQQPYVSVPPIVFDNFTGDFVIYPVGSDEGPIVFEVRDYRNGILMGSVTREITMQMLPGSNRYPTATGMNGTSQQITYVLPGDTVCFDIFSNDHDTGQSVAVNWNQAIPAATFTTAGSPYPTGTFCWVPAANDVRPQPFMFTATVTDNNCPTIGIGVYSYFIYVTLDSSLILLDINGDEENSSLVISPNPSAGNFTIRSKEKFMFLEIYNTLGDCILKRSFENTFNLSDQPKGVYLVNAIAEDGARVINKIMKN